ncbi:MAG: hypothetical protein DMG54_12020 [Acidobacteria bacterium]|nr:MAG: hypothetical protein DMG53_21130 [Acidobacteriota bacterium]PYU43557.1 MAG: hypothetical protein DMG54_12020 [Acidobacteriota bacterium]PYU75325.1 MAG: hypothetical protein DMG52_07685 [Acidobacteriota bacterium]
MVYSQQQVVHLALGYVGVLGAPPLWAVLSAPSETAARVPGQTPQRRPESDRFVDAWPPIAGPATPQATRTSPRPKKLDILWTI